MTLCATCNGVCDPKKQIVVARGTYCSKKCYTISYLKLDWIERRYGENKTITLGTRRHD